MRRRNILGFVVGSMLLASAGAFAATVGVGVGFDPTGLFVISALTETSINDSLDLRAEAGIATDEIAGLMLATGTILYHVPVPPIDPFVGLGGGIALTPPPFSTGVVAEAVLGVRVTPFDPVTVYAQLRYLVRWSGGGVTTGPIYEAGVQLRF
jgi:hypothetical protein